MSVGPRGKDDALEKEPVGERGFVAGERGRTRDVFETFEIAAVTSGQMGNRQVTSSEKILPGRVIGARRGGREAERAGGEFFPNRLRRGIGRRCDRKMSIRAAGA